MTESVLVAAGLNIWMLGGGGGCSRRDWYEQDGERMGWATLCVGVLYQLVGATFISLWGTFCLAL